MTTVVTNQPAAGESSSSSGLVIGLVLAALVLILLLAFGLPMIRGNYGGSEGNNGANAPAVNVPDQIDVNVKK